LAPEREHQASRHSAATEHDMTSAGAAAARQGGEAFQQGTQQAADMLRRAGAAESRAARTAADAGTRTARSVMSEIVTAQGRLLQDVAERFESIGRNVARATRDTAAGLRAFSMPPAMLTDDFRELQDGIAETFRGVMQTNLGATQELMRMTDPGKVFDLQRRFARDYLDTVMHGTAALSRAARRAAEHALRPIEQRTGYGEGHERNEFAGDHAVVADVMTHDVRLATPEDTVQQATRMMRDGDTDIVPVGEDDRLVGVVTDRDVARLLVAEGKDPARTKVRDVMTRDARFVFADDELGGVADDMAEHQTHRLPVVNRDRRVVGVVSLRDATLGRSRTGGRGVRSDSGPRLQGAAE
jgi:CBS domain-containing protein